MIKFKFNITFVFNLFLFTFTHLIWYTTCEYSFVADSYSGSLPQRTSEKIGHTYLFIKIFHILVYY